jgi:hypothetical protein
MMNNSPDYTKKIIFLQTMKQECSDPNVILGIVAEFGCKL